jgi:carboxypeptidase Taq
MDDTWMSGTFPADHQAALSRDVATALGFDFSCGRLDLSAHPFTGGAHPTDVRITTRFREDDFIQGSLSFSSVGLIWGVFSSSIAPSLSP